ncbi:MAG: tetratricopeptide repeat protein [Deltaproteobacteria bacterium]|jgi:TolA-binding protein|nr:tetratricopeptide repeat protein [Deltaproteobacteria bacterium]MBW2529956.1 tetratricopeptide repeat protein [Deltaproteobacteria bacterium]
MDEVGEELRDIKREIIESRGLVIKTNNLTNALAADLKSIGKRQQTFERRAFWNSAAANALFVVVVIAVVKFAWDARVESVEQETKRGRERIAKLGDEVKSLQRQSEARARGETAAAAFYELVRADKKRELIDQYESVRKEQLTRAERAFFRDAVAKSSSELSLGAYHSGLEHARSARWHEAALGFEESLRFSETASHASAAQLQLARCYRRLNRQRDAIPILVKLSEASADAEILDDAMFLLAECLIDIQAWNDAKTTLRTFIRRYPKSSYINDAKMALADLTVRH